MNNVVTLTQPEKPARPPAPPAYAELMVTSNFSFLRGGSHPEELIARAVALGLRGMGLCDRNSLAGVVRAYVALRDLKEDAEIGGHIADFRYVVGTRLVFTDETADIIAYPSDLAAYGRLTRLLTTGNRRAPKGECHLKFEDLAEFAQGQLFIVQIEEARFEEGAKTLRRLRMLAPDQVWLAAACTYGGTDRARLNRLAHLAARTGVPLIAVNDVLYHDPERRPLQDVVTCIREHLTIAEAGTRLEPNAERHLKDSREMARLFREHPEALAETTRFLRRIEFTLDQLKYNYPEETVGNGETAQETLERLTWEGAHKRYPLEKYENGIPEKVHQSLVAELKLIAELNYAAYFLTVQDIVHFARYEKNILCQGRGSAANSSVCYCLGVTEVDPNVSKLVFGRFLSTERHEPPDIDVDFEHEKREDVMQYIYGKYGRERTGLTSTVVTYRSKGALREVAKVFGLSSDTITALNSLGWGWYTKRPDQARVKSLGLDPNEATLRKVLELAGELMGFPRHLSQHVGGFVITRDRLDHLIPITNAAMENRTVVEWNKDDLDALGILKVDILALGMLTCLHRAFDMMKAHYGQELTLSGVLDEEREDGDRRKEGLPAVSDRVYAMTHRADTIGVFQIESRAQMSMLPRLKPAEFYDLVIEVAIVRPGPIQGGMVHPYLKRRQDGGESEYPSPELKDVLSRTRGIPLFQEQAMQIAVVGAGFSAGKADKLRRAMATWKRNGKIHEFRQEFIEGMLKNDYDREFAESCFKQIEGFGDYGFPESHAASFALLVYVSCWLKCHYPDVFACALLNSQPMGFYAPAQIVRDACDHGVDIREVDVNHSLAGNRLESGQWLADKLHDRHADMRDDIWTTHAVRLGLSTISGFDKKHQEAVVANRGAGYASIRDLWLRTGLPVSALQKLAEADAFGSLGLTRRQALWTVKGLMGTAGAETLPLFSAAGLPTGQPAEGEDQLPLMQPGEAVIHDYRSLSLSLKGHPVQFLRPLLDRRGTLPSEKLVTTQPGRIIDVAGLVLVRQRPGTASGVIFMTLEDETGIANIVVWNKVFENNRRIILTSRMLAIRGQVQREGLVTHVIARSFYDLTPQLLSVADGRDLGDGVLARADEGKKDSRPDPRVERERRRQEAEQRQMHAALPSGRNFH
ncbi:error-prone DNA polymerase [Paradevosia shaoguanensis]|uniref:Error-prone DNA polymerase n=1 Tax=Paradevosia shaoguanensis TaxID=1335043 RepID=A0AA41QQ52_9HYPH|nr:error-prone DNA polymerase [Paradevosia shaoguanensis]MCF1743799.1 error-prone DNA polymerase [Paradevosia shaoguanensis]MCI0128282.1 error-prone DNA polymerase [Paradevosia shaoguanensis]